MLKEEERQVIKIEVTKMCEPIPSRSKEEITKAIINMYMRLRADGYVVTQLHSDLGAEFQSKALESWCQSRTILHTYTPGDQPQMNGRCEVTVKHLQAAIRRTLHGAGALFTGHWQPGSSTRSCARNRLEKSKGHRPFCPRFW